MTPSSSTCWVYALGTRRAAGRLAHLTGTLLERFGSRGLEALGGKEELALRLHEEGSGKTFSFTAQLEAELDAVLAARS